MSMPILLPVVGLLSVLQADAGWRELQCPPTRRDDSQLWQTVSTLADLSQPGVLSAVHGEQNAYSEVAAGPEAAEILYRFDGERSLEYAELAVNVPIPEGAPGLGIEFLGDAHPLPVRLRVVDVTGECFQYTLGACQQGRWQFGAAVLQPRTDHWGGDENGELDAPLSLQSIVLDRATGQGFTGEGTISLRRLTICRREEGVLTPHGIGVEVPTDREWLVYEPGEPVRLRVAVTSPGADANAPLTLRLVDPFGVAQWDSTVEGLGGARDVSFIPPSPGHWDLQIRVAGAEDDALAPWADFRFAVIAPQAVDTDGPLGVCTHFSQGWDQRLLDLLPIVGVATPRDECSWAAVEVAPGELRIPDHVRSYVDRSEALGLTPLVIADYANSHYDDGGFPTSPEAIAGFARYGGFMASELGEAAPFFEIWNEWTGGCGMNGLRGDAEAYPPLFIATAEAIRAARPEARIVGVGGEYGTVEDLSGIVRTMIGQGAADHMDAFSIHPYHYPSLATAAYREGLVAVSEVANEVAGRELGMCLTEVGWPTHTGDRGSDFLHQSRCLVRMALMSLTVPSVEKVIWYDLKDDGTDLNYNEHNFGLVHNDSFGWAPKPAFVALAVLARALNGRQVGDWSYAENLWRVPMEGAGRRVTAVWAENGSATVTVAPGATVYDMFGQPIAAEATLTVGWDPVYVAE